MKTRILLLAACAACLIPALALAQAPATPAAPSVPDAAVPTDAAALHQLSLERCRQKNAKEAVEFAEKAVKADPTKAEYQSQLGIALSQRINEVPVMQMAVISSRMRKAFEKSLELDPNHIPGLIGLVRFLTNAPEIAGGNLTKAGEVAARLQQLDPMLGAMELGRIAEKDERPADALVQYEAVLQLRPNHTGALTAAGRNLAALGRKDEARARFEAALKINPELEAAKNGLAELSAAPAK